MRILLGKTEQKHKFVVLISDNKNYLLTISLIFIV